MAAKRSGGVPAASEPSSHPPELGVGAEGETVRGGKKKRRPFKASGASDAAADTAVDASPDAPPVDTTSTHVSDEASTVVPDGPEATESPAWQVERSVSAASSDPPPPPEPLEQNERVPDTSEPHEMQEGTIPTVFPSVQCYVGSNSSAIHFSY